ncbi:type II toxin-antitoxin system RelE/ParE family toxin [Undibacterium sp. Ji50W]|uniref:type II toxin-antitoxin system RelE/ParE family toxin n=1 Tax=Undibacterium sp. Ji50W TaxID=3413041 RepID=UPI003BF459C0
MKLIWKPIALADRERIMDYIAVDKPQAAIELDESFEHTADQLLLNPRMYKPGRVKKTREAVVHPNYIMVYVIEGGTISILRVLHSAQAWP